VTYRRIGGRPRYADYVVVFRKAERSPAVKAFVAMLRARQRRAQDVRLAVLQDHSAAAERRRAAT
jgi:hypothetical protein